MANLRLIHVLFATALLALAACAKDETTPEPEYGEAKQEEPRKTAAGGPTTTLEEKTEQPSEAVSAKAAEMPEAQRTIQALSDGQIARATYLVDSGEIAQARLARDKALDTRVKSYAAKMISQHNQSRQRGEKLAEQANIMPETSPLAEAIETGSSQMLQRLTDADRAQFDDLYINGQVVQHAKVLAMLEEQLIPNAANEALKSSLLDTRMMVSNHLREAQKIQQELSRSGD